MPEKPSSPQPTPSPELPSEEEVGIEMMQQRLEEAGNLREVRRLFESREHTRKNFFGPANWLRVAQKHNIDLSAFFDDPRNQEIMRNIPGGLELFHQKSPLNPDKFIVEDHELFLGLDKLGEKPLTMNEWQALEPNPPLFWRGQQVQSIDEQFAQKPLSFRWYLMPLQILPKSETHTYKEQCQMLPQNYEVAEVPEEYFKNRLYYLKNIAPLTSEEERVRAFRELNYDRWGRTNTLDSHGLRVLVGPFQSDGLVVNGYWDGDRGSRVGLAVSRKF